MLTNMHALKQNIFFLGILVIDCYIIRRKAVEVLRMTSWARKTHQLRIFDTSAIIKQS